MFSTAPQMITKSSVLKLAEGVFGDKEKATRWLSKTHLALGEKTPLQLLETPDGTKLVHTVLLRIEYGVLT